MKGNSRTDATAPGWSFDRFIPGVIKRSGHHLHSYQEVLSSSSESPRGLVVIFRVIKRSCRHLHSHQEVLSSSSVSSRGLVSIFIIFIIFKIIKTFYLCWVGSGVDVILIIHHPLVLLSSRGSVIIFVGLSFLSVLIWWFSCYLCK